jgi:hypothetical protein
MSVANIKGGFFRGIEINRDSSGQSETTLLEPLIKQGENYVCQVERFVTNLNNPINNIDKALVTVLRKPAVGVAAATLVDMNAAHGYTAFIAKNVFTVTELARQLHEFCNGFDGLTLTINPNFSISIKMNAAFGDQFWVLLNNDFASLVGLSKYLFYFRATVGGVSQLVTNEGLLWLAVDELVGIDPVFQIANFHFRPGLARIAGDPATHTFVSGDTIFNLDTRQFLDVTFSMSHVPRVAVLDGESEARKVLARFPLKDFTKKQHVFLNDFDSYGVRETTNLGLVDLCQKNPDVHTTMLLPGMIQHANVRIETVYLEGGKFVTVPTDFGSHGFWSLKLILAKRTK